MQHLKSQKGLGLVEVILALGVSVIVITGMVSLAVYTMRTSLTGRLLFEGTKYASQQLEMVRAYRDQAATWAAFRTATSTCTGANVCNIASNNAGGFTISAGRTTIGVAPAQVQYWFTVTYPIAGENSGNATVVRVAAQSEWQVGGLNKDAYVYTDLSNWRQR